MKAYVESLGIIAPKAVYRNLTPAQLTERAVPPEPSGEFRVEVVSASDAVAEFTRFPVYSWSRIQRRSIFESGDAFFINRPAAEDVEQTIRSLAVSDRVCYYGKPLYVYYKVGGSATNANRAKEARAMEDTARSTLDSLAPDTVMRNRSRNGGSCRSCRSCTSVR